MSALILPKNSYICWQQIFVVFSTSLSVYFKTKTNFRLNFALILCSFRHFFRSFFSFSVCFSSLFVTDFERLRDRETAV